MMKLAFSSPPTPRAGPAKSGLSLLRPGVVEMRGLSSNGYGKHAFTLYPPPPRCTRVVAGLLMGGRAAGGALPGADAFLPALILLVKRANPPSLHSTLEFVQVRSGAKGQQTKLRRVIVAPVMATSLSRCRLDERKKSVYHIGMCWVRC